MLTKSDSIPGGMWIENLGPKPVKVYSHTERLNIMKQRGLQEFVRHTGVPGTDKSPHTTNWDVGGTRDPRPYMMLNDEEKRIRRQETADRIGVPVEVLDRLEEARTGAIEVEESVDTVSGPRDGGDMPRRVIRQFNIAGTTEDAKNLMRIINGG